jgi:hypothetical protein
VVVVVVLVLVRSRVRMCSRRVVPAGVVGRRRYAGPSPRGFFWIPGEGLRWTRDLDSMLGPLGVPGSSYAF